MNETDDVALCDFYRLDGLNASLSCSLNVKNNIDTNLSFKGNLINIGSTPLYLKGLNNLQFSYKKIIEEEPVTTKDTAAVTENNFEPKLNYNKSSSSNKAGIIATIVIASVVAIGGIVTVSVYFIKIRKPKVPNSNDITGDIQKSVSKNDIYASAINITK